MKQELYFVYGHDSGVKRSKLLLFLVWISVMILTSVLHAQELPKDKRFNIVVLDFLYVIDGGFEPYYSFEKNVERQILKQNMEEELISQNGFSVKMEALPVIRGSMDYLENVVEENGEHELYTEHDICVWGVVEPVSWPLDYDLLLYIFPNSLKYQSKVQDVFLRIRKGRIVKWDNQKCDLPEQSMSAIPQITVLKYMRSQLTAEHEEKLQQVLSDNLKRIPFGIRKSMVNGGLTMANAGRSIIGYLQLELERDRHIVLDLNTRHYKQMQRYLFLDQPLSWPLQQSSMVMPDIAIELNNEADYIPTERLVNSGFSYTTDKFMVGILPFVNQSESDGSDWISYGFEYLIDYRLAGISDFRLLDKDFILNALNQIASDSSEDRKIRFQSGERTLGFNLAISGKYQIEGEKVITDVHIINSLDGDTLSFFRYSENLTDLTSIPDRFVNDFLIMTEIFSTATEKRHMANRFTSSAAAFESFCRGRMESESRDRDFDRVIAFFRDAIEKDPQFWEAYYNLGIAYYNSGNNEQALSVFNKLIGLFPNFEKPFIERGRVYERLNELILAANDFQTAMRIAPSSYQGYFYLGRLYVSQKRYPEAVKMLQQAAILKPGTAEILYQLGDAYFGQRYYKRALPFYEKAMKDMPDYLTGRQKLGECYYHVHNFTAARAAFDKILTRLPGNAETNFMYGITVYKQAILDDFITAFLEMFNLDVKSQTDNKKKKIDPAGERAKILREMIKRFKKAYLAKNEFFEAAFNLAMTYSELGRLDSAVVYYERTIGINPESAKAHLMLAKTYEKRFQRQRALEKYKDVLKLEPAYFINDPTLGREYHNLNLVQLVVGELEEALKNDPHDIQANLSLARIYYAQGFYGKAANLSRRVLTVNPENLNAKKILAQVGRI